MSKGSRLEEIFLYFCILCPSLILASLYPSRISSGMYEEHLDPPVFYDTFVPIIYNYQYPTWTNLDTTLRDWRGLCLTDDFAPSYTCPVFFYLERFIERIQTEIVKTSSKSSIQNISTPIHTNIPSRCDRIQRHFHSLMTSKSSLDQYIESFNSCQHDGISPGINQKLIQDYIYNIKYIYRMMVSKFEAEFSTKTGSNDRFGPAYYVNQITASQGLMLFNYWVEHTRWENAVRSCSLQRVPTTLVKPGNLSEALNKIDEDLIKTKLYTLSIPPNETSVYMTSPVTDCTFTDSGTFLVRILVPVKRKLFNPKLIKLQPVPFLLNDGQETYSICQIFGLEGTYVYDETSGYLAEAPHCQPGPEGGLCQVENRARIPLPNLCAASYFSSNLIDVKKYCSFQCEKVVDNLYSRLPIIRRPRPDVFVITGNANMDVVIQCPGKPNTILNPGELGSLEIILPCQCSLNFKTEVYFPEQPCGQNLTITQILPVQFFNEQYLTDNSNSSSSGVTNFNGTLDKSMMESKLFTSLASSGSGSKPGSTGSETLFPSQRDLDSGVVETVVDDHDDQSSNGNDETVVHSPMSSAESKISSALVWLWILFAIQCTIFIGFIVIVSKRLGLFCYGAWFLFPDRRHLSFDNPLAPGSNQNNADHSKRDFQDGSHYEI